MFEFFIDAWLPVSITIFVILGAVFSSFVDKIKRWKEDRKC